MEGQPFEVDPESLLADMGWVRGLARSLVGDPQAADDLTQETWLAALRRPPGEGVPRAWLARVVHNFARQRARSEAARSFREGTVAADAVHETLPSADELAERMERQRILAEALTRLAEPYRSTLILRFSEDLAPIAIARSQDLPPGTVRRRIKVGLERLREDLDRRFDGRPAWIAALRPFLDAGRSAAVATPPGAAASIVSGLFLMKGAWVVVGLVAVLGVWWAWGAGSPASPELEPARTGVAASGTGAPGQELAALRSSEHARVAQAGSENAAAAAGRVGRVLLEPTAPADPTLEVLWLAQPATRAELANWLAVGAGSKHVLGRVAVGPDGRFVLPPDVGGVGALLHLQVLGRTLYAERSTTCELDPTREVVLRPRTGAWIRGTLAAGGAESGADVELVRTGGPLSLAVSLAKPPEWRTRTAGDGTFEFRAVPTESAYTVCATPSGRTVALGVVEGLVAGEVRQVALHCDAGSALRGHVFDADGRPAAGALVEAHAPGIFGVDELLLGRAIAGSDGAYVLEHLPERDVLLRASLDGHLDSPRGFAAAPFEPEEVTLELGRGRELTGIVLGPDGAPFAGASLRIDFDRGFATGPEGYHGSRGFSGHGTSDARGLFRVRGMGRGPFVVIAEGSSQSEAGAGKALRAELREVRPGQGRLELELAALVDLEGRALDSSGQPVQSFELRAVRGAPGSLGESVVDRCSIVVQSSSGRFRLEGLAPGEWVLSLVGEHIVSAEPLRVELGLGVAGPMEPVELRAVLGGSVEGSVVDASGLPVAGARVHEMGQNPFWTSTLLTAPPPRETRTDGEGRFVLGPLLPGNRSIVAEAVEHAPSEAQAVTILEGAVTGDPSGGPTLRLRTGGAIQGEIWTGRSPTEPAPGRMVHLEHDVSGGVEIVGTDARGRFLLEHLEPGSWTVAIIDVDAAWAITGEDVSPADLAKLVRVEAVVLKDGETTELVIGKGEGAPIHVTGIVRQAGERLARTGVTFVPAGGGDFNRMAFTQTDENGRFEAELKSPGLYNIMVPRYPMVPGTNTVDFLRDVPAGVSEWNVELDVPGAGVSGRVFDEAGEPVARARVTLLGDGGMPEGSEGEETGGVYVEIVTDAEGFYEFPALRPGSYLLAAGGATHGPGPQAAELARTFRSVVDLRVDEWREDVDFELAAGNTLVAQVVDSAGEPVRGATIFVRDAGSGRALDIMSGRTSDGAGHVTYPGLAVGRYSVIARTWDGASAESAVVPIDGEPHPPVELVLNPAARLRVHLLDARGRPVAGRVQLFDEQDRDVGTLYPLADLMRFIAIAGFSPSTPLFGPLAPGNYRLTAEAFDGRRTSAAVVIDAAGEVAAYVTFDDG